MPNSPSGNASEAGSQTGCSDFRPPRDPTRSSLGTGFRGVAEVRSQQGRGCWSCLHGIGLERACSIV